MCSKIYCYFSFSLTMQRVHSRQIQGAFLWDDPDQDQWSTDESTLDKDSSVHLIYHDPSDLRSLIRIISKEHTLTAYYKQLPLLDCELVSVSSRSLIQTVTVCIKQTSTIYFSQGIWLLYFVTARSPQSWRPGQNTCLSQAIVYKSDDW